MDLALSIDSDAESSLQAQIFDQIRNLILSGRLKAEMALPPSRVLAEKLGVSRNTVMIAYENLVSEGYVESRGTAGVYVSATAPEDYLLVRTGESDCESRDETNTPSGEPVLCFAGAPGGEIDGPTFDFWVGRSAASAFPLQVWRKIVSNILSVPNGPQNLTDYCDPAGLPELRQAIADRLARGRGMDVTMDQIIITNGGQDALNLIVNILRDQTQQFCIENPCYLGASMLFQSHELPIEPIPIDAEGIVADRLSKKRNSLLFVTPSHQFPTGVMMSLRRRSALLQWADDTDSYIIEDDYDSEFRYDGAPLTALAGLDRGRRVFYVGSFSKSVGAGVRLGFAVFPPDFWTDARAQKALMSNGQSWLEQQALAQFMHDGHFDKHIRKLSQIYKSRRDCLVSALQQHFDNPELLGHDGGLHFVWRLPLGMPSGESVQKKARALGVGVYCLSSGAAHDFGHSTTDDMLMLGYSSLTEAEIDEAVALLKAMLHSEGYC